MASQKFFNKLSQIFRKKGYRLRIGVSDTGGIEASLSLYTQRAGTGEHPSDIVQAIASACREAERNGYEDFKGYNLDGGSENIMKLMNGK